MKVKGNIQGFVMTSWLRPRRQIGVIVGCTSYRWSQMGEVKMIFVRKIKIAILMYEEPRAALHIHVKTRII